MNSIIEEQNIILKSLRTLEVSTLVNLIGSKKVKSLEQLGIEANSKNLASILFTIKGTDIFKNIDLRKSLYFSHNLDKKSKEDLSICSFSWSENQKSELFFKLINIPVSFIDFKKKDKIDSQLTLGPIDGFILHDYQKWMKYEINKFFHSFSLRTLIHMPTGSGKTRVTLEATVDYLVSYMPSSASIVWLAHSEELCEQAYETFKSVWLKKGNREIEISRFWGKNNINEINTAIPSLIIMSFGSAYNLLKSDSNEKFKLFSNIAKKNILLIVDEAHQSIAPTYETTINSIINDQTKIIGLTATPGRASDDETLDLKSFYNSNIIKFLDHKGAPLGQNAVPYLEERGYLSKAERKVWVGSDIELDSDKLDKIIKSVEDIPHSYLESLGNDAKRNIIITKHIIALMKERKQIILFAPSKGSAEDIAISLKFNGLKAESITSDLSEGVRKNIIDNFKKNHINIITNYGVLTTGFDAPNTNVVVIARPTKSAVLYSQMIGRGLRGPKMGGTENCLIVDVKDNVIDYPTLEQQFVYFDKYYNYGDI